MRYDAECFDIAVSQNRWCLDYYDINNDSWETIAISTELASNDCGGYDYFANIINVLCGITTNN